MIIDYQQIYRDIHDFIVAATGLDDESVRPAYVNASARPSQDRELLCSVNLINQSTIGIDGRISADESLPATDMAETIYGDRSLTASIKSYGADAQNTAEKIIAHLSSSIGIEFLNNKDIGYLRHGQVLDISSLQNGSFESRRQIDIEFHVVFETTKTVNAINSSEIGWTFYGAETVTGTIEVTE